MNLHRLTIANLEYIVETLKDSQEDSQIILFMAAQKELARRKELMKKVG